MLASCLRDGKWNIEDGVYRFSTTKKPKNGIEFK